MDMTEQKIVQYLNEAHATEQALVTALQSQIAMTPGGSYRDGSNITCARRATTQPECSDV